jgi:hypothetical protein
MSMLGRAVVAIWNDILPEGRADFIGWHNREHIPERVGIKGFLRGRRYIAEHGAPQYFTLYEAENAAVLTGPDYLARLNDPTPWTRRATQAFRNTVRGVCETVFTTGPGDGGVMATLRFSAVPGRAEALAAFLKPLLAELLQTPALSGVHLCVADSKASGIETRERRGREVGVPDWIVLIEGSWASAVDEATDRPHGHDLVSHGVHGSVDRGLYRLEYTRTDTARNPT